MIIQEELNFRFKAIRFNSETVSKTISSHLQRGIDSRGTRYAVIVALISFLRSIYSDSVNNSFIKFDVKFVFHFVGSLRLKYKH